jgi:hypothetical protein
MIAGRSARMDEKHKDTVFGIILFALGLYVLAESVLMVIRAAQPPLRIDRFSISPGMFPLVLGAALMFFAGLLIAGSLKGAGNPWRALPERLKAALAAARASFGDDDFLAMLIGVVMMFVYCFFIVGNVPFWGGALGFLLVMMIFLRFAGPAVRFARSANLGVIVLTAVAAVGIVVFLFENVFKTVLP